jgi:hypothetical protein
VGALKWQAFLSFVPLAGKYTASSILTPLERIFKRVCLSKKETKAYSIEKEATAM